MRVYKLLQAKPLQTLYHTHFYLSAKVGDVDAHLQAPLTHIHTHTQHLSAIKTRKRHSVDI